MVIALTSLLTAVGVAAPAGLNAYLALLTVGLAARFTSLVTLEAPYDLLTNTWTLVALAILLGVEVFADKVPVVDSVNDTISTVIRPAAGAILFLANTRAIELDPTLAGILGLLLAGSVHGLKATTRPVVTAVTGGLANPIVSMIEDLLAAAGVILSLIVPLVGFLLVVLLIIGMVALAVVVRRRLRRFGRRLPGGRQPPGGATAPPQSGP
jgi:hypothetical protein